MKKGLLVLLTLFAFGYSQATCLSCWELHKVDITLTNGQVITGYIKWNEAWLNDVIDTAVWKNRFPESVLPYYQNLGYKWDLEFISDIYTVKNDSMDEFIVTKPVCQGNLDYTKIKSIRESVPAAKVYHGADEIPLLSEAEINQLNTNPVATYLVDSGLFGTQFISYNKAITYKELSKITPENVHQMADALRQKGVIVFSNGY